MNFSYRFTYLIIVLMIVSYICEYGCIEPVTMGLASAAGVLATAGYWGYCKKFECCKDTWIKHKPDHLKRELDKHVFGQHLVNDLVSKVIVDHYENENPKKALVISFHGWTGSGKNYVSDIITRLLYFKGKESKFVHKMISTDKFSHAENIENYKADLKMLIEKETKKCPHSLFIFDEIDKMPVGLADVLKPYLDYHQEINGVDYRKNVFIFLSNTGGEKINKETYKHFKTGKKREDITAKQMDIILRSIAFNVDGGLKSSDLILSSLIDFFIPFLPLERKHVKQCAEVLFKERGKLITDKLLEKVASELQYFPRGDETFSSSGCKRVEKKVSLYS